MDELAAIHNELPRLKDLKIDGRSLVEATRETLREEPFLGTCVEHARKNRPVLKDDQAAADDRNAWELRIRQMVRGLLLVHKNYETARKGQELSLRYADQCFEQLIAPPLGGNSQLTRSMNVSHQVPRVLKAQFRLYEGRELVVSQWLEFKEKSSSLYRELGIMPYEDWEAFYRSFKPGAGGTDSPAAPARP